MVEYDVKFSIVGKTWVFLDPEVRRLEGILAEHNRKATALGAKPKGPPRKKRQPAAATA